MRERASAWLRVPSARAAASSFFLVLGVASATWAALVPFVKARLALDEARLGGVLLVFGLGTVVSTVAAPLLIRRFGSRATLIAVGSALALFLPLLAAAPSTFVLAALLFGFGACTGLTGVTANAQAIVVEAASGRSLMSSFHALFSIGGLAGAGSASVALRAGLSMQQWTLLVAAALVLLIAVQHRGLVRDRVDRVAASRSTAMPPMPVLVVGVMTMALYLAEGAVLDWGAVFLHEYREYDVAAAALGYAAFSVAMAAGRLLGDRIVARLGPVAVVRYGSIVAAAGFAIFVLLPWAPAGLIGCALIGVGASNVVPTLISSSARVSSFPTAAAVSAVAAMGTIGLIAGPALIGFLAKATSLSLALGLLAVVLLAVALNAERVFVLRPVTSTERDQIVAEAETPLR
jgi:fucose permease